MRENDLIKIFIIGIVSAFIFSFFVNQKSEEIVSAQSVIYPEHGGTGTTTLPVDLQLLVGQGSNLYGPRTLTAGSNIEITTTTNTLTITSTGGGSNWQFSGPNAITPTSTVGIHLTASSTIDANFTMSQATATQLYATTLGIGSQYFTDLTGTGMTISSGTLIPNLTGGEGITFSNPTVSFDCSEVTDSAGDHLTCSSENLVVSDDWWDALTDMVLTDTYVYVGNGSNDPVGVDLTGDGSITNTGILSINNLSITSQATGSIIYYSGEASDQWTNLAIGTDDYVLTASSTVTGGIVWQAATGGTSPWTTDSNVVNLNTDTDTVSIGTSTDLAKFAIVGDADEVQFYLRAHTTQNNDYFVAEDSSETELFVINAQGAIDSKVSTSNSFQNTTDFSSNQVLTLASGNRATAANNDEGFIVFSNDDSNGIGQVSGRLSWIMLDVSPSSLDGAITLDVVVDNSLTEVARFGDAIDFTGASSVTLSSTTLQNGFVSQASSTISNTLNVTGAVTFDDTLLQTGLATLSNGLISNASSSFMATTTFNENVVFNNGAEITVEDSLSFSGVNGDLIIPNALEPSFSTQGQVIMKTRQASTSIRFYDGTTIRTLYDTFEKSYWMASTTIDGSNRSFDSATTSHTLWNPARRTVLIGLFCKTDAGTLAFRCGDGSNWTEYLSCDSSGGEDDGSMTNNNFNVREDFICEVGSSASSPSEVTLTAEFRYIADGD